jgi:hypothetical protein
MMYSIQSSNAIANFFIYTTRHKDLWYGIKYLFLNKNLTEAKLKQLVKDEANTKSKTVNVKSTALAVSSRNAH